MSITLNSQESAPDPNADNNYRSETAQAELAYCEARGQVHAELFLQRQQLQQAAPSGD